MKEKKLEVGDRVIITSGHYMGQMGNVVSVMTNGAMVERDIKENRRFCPIKFEQLTR